MNYPDAPAPYPAPAQASKAQALGITALVFAILGWVFIPVLGAIGGILFAQASRREAIRFGEPVPAVATVGKVLSWVQLILVGLFIALALVLGLVFPLVMGGAFDDIGTQLGN